MSFELGIAYIKYEKASAAARAMEEMNGTVIPPHTRPLKVSTLVSHSMIVHSLFRLLYQVHVVKVVFGIQMNMKKCYVYLLLYQNI